MMALGVGCFVIPVSSLLIISVIGVMLADTSLVSTDFIYLGRFVPVGVLFARVMSLPLLRKVRGGRSYSMPRKWLPFLLLASMSCLYSLEPAMSVQRVVSAVLVVFGFGLGIPFYISDTRKIARLIKMISAVMGGAILYSLFSPSGLQAPASNEFVRLSGVFYNPNTLGIIAMQAFFPILYLRELEKRKIVRRMYLGILIAVGVAIMMSGSRASALGLVVGLLFFLMNSKGFTKTFSNLMSAGLIIAGVYLTMGYLYPSLTGDLFRTGSSGREAIMRMEWGMIGKAPFFGSGFGGTDRFYFDEVLRLNRMEGGYLSGSHNSYMRLLVELGVAGGAAVLYAFGGMMLRFRRLLPQFEDQRLGVALLAAVVGSLVNAFFESWLFAFGSSTTLPFWLLLSILSYQADQAAMKIKQTSAAGVDTAKMSPHVFSVRRAVVRRF